MKVPAFQEGKSETVTARTLWMNRAHIVSISAWCVHSLNLFAHTMGRYGQCPSMHVSAWIIHTVIVVQRTLAYIAPHRRTRTFGWNTCTHALVQFSCRSCQVSLSNDMIVGRGHEGRFSWNPLPVFFSFLFFFAEDGHSEQFWHGQGRSLWRYSSSIFSADRGVNRLQRSKEGQAILQ